MHLIMGQGKDRVPARLTARARMPSGGVIARGNFDVGDAAHSTEAESIGNRESSAPCDSIARLNSHWINDTGLSR